MADPVPPSGRLYRELHEVHWRAMADPVMSPFSGEFSKPEVRRYPFSPAEITPAEINFCPLPVMRDEVCEDRLLDDLVPLGVDGEPDIAAITREVVRGG